MAEERIDIVVDDKVNDNVDKKIRAIADSADKGATSVQKLKSALADINVTSVTKLQAALTANSNALARELNASAKLEAQRGKNAIADAKAATEAQRLATETARTEAAQMRAAAAAARSQAAQLALATAQARATATAGQAANSETQLGSAVEQAKMKFDAGEISIRKYVAAIQAANAANDVGAPSINNAAAGVNKLGVAQEGAAKSGAKMASTNANIVAQLNDIGVSLAGGQNPFLVMIQQGSQLSYIAGTMEGGVKALTARILGMLAPFAAAAAVVGLLALQFKFWNDQVASDANMKQYAATLGLTSKEMKELKDVTVTSGDMMLGVWDTIKEAMNLSENFNSMKAYAKSAVDFIWRTLKNFAFGMVGLFTGLFELIRQVFTNLPAIIMDQVTMAANGVIKAINWVAQQSNSIIGTSFGEIPELANKNAGAATGAWKAATGAALKGFKDAEAGYNAFVDRSEQNGIKRAQNRLKSQADALKDKRGAGPKPKEDHTAENRAHALDVVNLKLDDEIKRMKMLKDERAIAQRMDQIEESLAQKKIKLNDAERASILAKVTAIESYKYVQAESDRILEEAVAPQRTMNAAIEAASTLYDKGAITLDQYNRQLNKATLAFDQASDPLYAMNEAVNVGERTVGKYGVALEQANYLEQVRQTLQAQGIPLYDVTTGKINAQAAALVARNDALRQEQMIQSTVGGIVNPMLEQQMLLDNKAAYYEEIDRLRQNDVLSEQQAQQARFALDAKFSEMRLSNYSTMFGTMAKLSSSGNKKLAAIGKAAAVAQATIDGFAAVQKALASAPPPLNFVMAAATGVMTGVQIAGILSTNVGSFATGGQFQVDGKGGIDNNNINMNVSRGERVTIETPAQQKANDSQGGGANVSVPVKIVNNFDEKEFIGAMDSSEGEQVIGNIIRRNRSEFADLLGVPRS